MRDWRLASRRKLLALLPRTALEGLSTSEAPWHASRDTLMTNVCLLWPADDVREAVDREIDNLWRRANAEPRE